MTRTPTLSQSFDIGDFIAPDILSVVDSNVRAVAADVLASGGLTGNLVKAVDLHMSIFIDSNNDFGGLVPSMDPDEFMPYKRPKAPDMTGFESFEAPIIQEESDPEPEYEIEIPLGDENEAASQTQTDFDSVDLDVGIPDLATIEQAADMIQEDIVIELPEVSRYNANLLKVKFDTIRFNETLMRRIRIITIITIIVVVNIILIMYLLSQ